MTAAFDRYPHDDVEAILNSDAKALITIAIVAVFAFGLFIWPTVGPALWPSIVGGLFTLGAAGFAAFVVFWQLRKQAENAAASNLQSEKLKLKKDIYSTVSETCDETSKALGALHRYMLEGWAELREHRVIEENKGRHGRPQFSVKELSKRYNDVSNATLKLSSLTEKWAIVEPRTAIFRKAFSLQGEFLNGAYAPFMTWAYRYFRSTRTPEGGEYWEFEDPYVDDYRARMNALFNEIVGMQAFIHDFRVAMQNALLGELFGRTLEMRKPADPKVVVIDLDRCDEVEAQLEDLKKRGKIFDTEAGLTSVSRPGR